MAWHKLKKNVKNRIPEYMVFVDTETSPEPMPNNDLVKHVLKLGIAKFIRFRNMKPTEEKLLVFGNPDNFWDWLTGLGKKKSCIYVFSHNQHFDFNVLAGFKNLEERGFKITKFVIDSDVFIVKAKNDVKSLFFIDTTNFFKTSLETIGEVLGLPKMKIDFESCSLKELEEYCLRDVEILEKLVLELLKFIRENNLGNFAPTAASLAFNVFRHKFMNTDIFIHRHPEVMELESMSYRGGRNEAFKIGKYSGEKFYMLDVNSMYPYVMLNNEFPVKFVRLEKNPTLSGLLRALKRFLVIAEVEVELSEPLIGLKKDKLIFPIGRFRAVLTTPEIELVLKHGKIRKVIRYAIYERGRIFADYVKFFYALKEKYESENNRPFREFSKLMLNSLYGKFGQRVRKVVKINDNSGEENHIEVLIDLNTRKKSLLIYLNNKVYEVMKTDYSEDAFPAISSFVTSYARCYLTELIKRAGWDNVYYVDTDSLLVNQTGFENLKDLVKGNELGALKLVGIYDDIEIVACKHYRLGEKTVKLKGIKKDAKQLEDNVFMQSQFLKTKTLLHKRLNDTVYEKNVIKKLSLTYDKRVVLEDGSTRPIVMFTLEGE